MVMGEFVKWPWKMSVWLSVPIVLLLALTMCVGCAPTRRPLNERPSEELAWQTLILVDTLYGNESDRRITPKSVFIVPKLTSNNGGRTSSLPDCADGYRPDSMGRCIKFVKVDEAAHLNFLLHRLNAMYATTTPQLQKQQQQPIPEPFQFNIPIADENNPPIPAPVSEIQDITISVAPTTEVSKKIMQDKWNSQIESPKVDLLPMKSETVTNVVTTTGGFTLDSTIEVTTADDQTKVTEFTTEADMTTMETPKALFYLIEELTTEDTITTEFAQEMTTEGTTELVATSTEIIEDQTVEQTVKNEQKRLTTEQIEKPLEDPKPDGNIQMSHRNRERNQEFWKPSSSIVHSDLPSNIQWIGEQRPLVFRLRPYPNSRTGRRDFQHVPSFFNDQSRAQPDLYSFDWNRQSTNHRHHTSSFS